MDQVEHPPAHEASAAQIRTARISRFDNAALGEGRSMMLRAEGGGAVPSLIPWHL